MSSLSWNLLELQTDEPHFRPTEVESVFLARWEVICVGVVYLGTNSQTESCYVTVFTSLKKNTYRVHLHGRYLRSKLIEWHPYNLVCWTASLGFSQGKKQKFIAIPLCKI